MKNLVVLCIFLAFAADGLAQTPAQDRAPIQIAQAGGPAGGAASGATVPAATTGATSSVAAVIAAGFAAVAALTAYSSTTSMNSAASH